MLLLWRTRENYSSFLHVSGTVDFFFLIYFPAAKTTPSADDEIKLTMLSQSTEGCWCFVETIAHCQPFLLQRLIPKTSHQKLRSVNIELILLVILDQDEHNMSPDLSPKFIQLVSCHQFIITKIYYYLVTCWFTNSHLNCAARHHVTHTPHTHTTPDRVNTQNDDWPAFHRSHCWRPWSRDQVLPHCHRSLSETTDSCRTHVSHADDSNSPASRKHITNFWVRNTNTPTVYV